MVKNKRYFSDKETGAMLIGKHINFAYRLLKVLFSEINGF